MFLSRCEAVVRRTSTRQEGTHAGRDGQTRHDGGESRAPTLAWMKQVFYTWAHPGGKHRRKHRRERGHPQEKRRRAEIGKYGEPEDGAALRCLRGLSEGAAAGTGGGVFAFPGRH